MLGQVPLSGPSGAGVGGLLSWATRWVHGGGLCHDLKSVVVLFGGQLMFTILGIVADTPGFLPVFHLLFFCNIIPIFSRAFFALA